MTGELFLVGVGFGMALTGTVIMLALDSRAGAAVTAAGLVPIVLALGLQGARHRRERRRGWRR